MKTWCVRQDLAATGTPSRLHNASVPVAPRVALHSLEGTLAGRLLSQLPPGTRMGPQEGGQAGPEAVRDLDSIAASAYTLPATKVLLPPLLHQDSPYT